MRAVLSRSDLAKLTRLIADVAETDVGRVARDAAGSAAGQAAILSKDPQATARDALSSVRRRAQRRGGRGRLASLRLTTEPPRSEPDRTMLISLLLGFLAGLAVMYLIQRRAQAPRPSDQARIDDRLAGITPSDTEAAAEVPSDAGKDLVGVMGPGPAHDGTEPGEPVGTLIEPA